MGEVLAQVATSSSGGGVVVSVMVNRPFRLDGSRYPPSATPTSCTPGWDLLDADARRLAVAGEGSPPPGRWSANIRNGPERRAGGAGGKDSRAGCATAKARLPLIASRSPSTLTLGSDLQRAHGVGMQRFFQRFAHGGFLHHDGNHHRHVIGDLRHHAEVVGDEDRDTALGLQLLDGARICA